MTNNTVYWLYFLECDNQTIYTGSTGNIRKRFEQHQSGHGSTWTSNNRPIKVIAVKRYPSRTDAYAQERKLKKYSKLKKVAWIQANCIYDVSVVKRQ